MFGIAVFAAVLFGSAAFAPQAFAGADPPAPNEAGKVTICHNGDDGPETIEVSGNAVQKHIDNHGDSVGECVVPCADCEADLTAAREACGERIPENLQCFQDAQAAYDVCLATNAENPECEVVPPESCELGDACTTTEGREGLCVEDSEEGLVCQANR